MDVSTPQGAGAAPGLVYTTKACAAPGLVYTSVACAAPGLVYTSVACAGPGQHKKIGSSIPRNIYFEILLSVR